MRRGSTTGKQSAPDLQAAIATAEGKVDLIIAGLDARSIAASDATPSADTIRVAMTWFAPDGPYADWTGSDAVIQAMSGVAYPTGAIGRRAHAAARPRPRR